MGKRSRNNGRMARTGSRGENIQRSDKIYVYGNTARKLELQRQLESEPIKKPSVEVQKNREKAHHMNAGYVFFLGAALAAAAYILVNYLQLQAELTNLTKTVADRKSVLIELQVSNEEQYNRISSSIDLEEIKRVAMGVLGMTYAEEGQIVVYESEQYDYMRQVAEPGQ